MPSIAVDAMGGDFAPEEVVKGVAQVSLRTDIQCTLVGNEQEIQAILDRVPYNPERIGVQHTTEFVTMAEDPKVGLRRKRRASVLVAARLVADGHADAVVTAGNTGAAVIACTQCFKAIQGVFKPALASVYPRQTEYPGQDQLALLLDVGATIRCDATELVQFAIMGSAYARHVSKVPNPRVALLNMGVEETRGGDILVEAYHRLKNCRGINFVGNIEGTDLAKGKADVIVCEGLLGNVALKILEGVAEVVVDLAGTARRESWRWKLGFFMLAGSIGRLRDLTDYAIYGGAPILGFEHVMIKSHGRSNARAVENAIKVAAKAVRDGVTQEIAAGIEQV
ncbi:MAG: Phosphate:acyl-ACP acyltransferase PlsX [Deltaproteobacteria bacterium]|nr:Phosphate:acyl-ACP acyltransferase PlsX [Deltaproteobacteria bacterium]